MPPATISSSTYLPARVINNKYDDDNSSDLIIRTSQDFLVHKWPLKHYSPIIRDMLSTRQGTDPAERDIVELPEDPKTIDFLLTVIYYRQQPGIDSIDDLTTFLEAAVKYNIADAIHESQSLMKRFLHAKKSVLQVYVLALKFDFKTVVERAFRRCLLIGLTNPYHYDVPALRNLPLEKYQQLLFSKCKRAELASVILSKHFRFAKRCNLCNRHGCGWWDEYILMVMIRLKDRPTSEVMFERFIIDSCCRNHCAGEKLNLAQSEPYFLIVKAEIDALPWNFSTADWTRAQSVEVDYYPSFEQAIAGVQDALDDETDVEG